MEDDGISMMHIRNDLEPKCHPTNIENVTRKTRYLNILLMIVMII